MFSSVCMSSLNIFKLLPCSLVLFCQHKTILVYYWVLLFSYYIQTAIMQITIRMFIYRNHLTQHKQHLKRHQIRCHTLQVFNFEVKAKIGGGLMWRWRCWRMEAGNGKIQVMISTYFTGLSISSGTVSGRGNTKNTTLIVFHCHIIFYRYYPFQLFQCLCTYKPL